MYAAPMLRLSQQQVSQLLASCTSYRSHIWRTIPPSPERNQVLRVIQSLQGRLVAGQEQAVGELSLVISQEEGRALRQMLTTMLTLYGQESASHQRTQRLGEVASLRLLLEQTLRQRQE
jgi:hypothetical protein